MPGVSCTVEEQIESLKEVAGNDVAKHIRSVPDESIMRIVENWPRNFAPERAISLGFTAESDFKEIIKVYMTEYLPKA